MKLTHILSAAALLGALVLTSCKEKSETLFPVYAWDGVGEQVDPDAVKARFQEWKDRGVVGVCIGSHVSLENTATVSRIAHEVGLEYHAWEACMLRAGLPHEWYAVNRLGQRADEFPAYVDYYKALDPRNPAVREYLVGVYSAIADVPDVDYVHLDYIRYPDAVLSRGLWDKYGLDFSDGPYPPADYCYCDDCVAAFLAETGIDIRTVEDPEQVPEWGKFRCDAVTGLVEMIAEAVHAKGKKLSSAVFPGPDSHARWMVRQQWDEWPLDMVFPMNYNDFYLEPAEWLETITAEEVASAGDVPVMSGLFICPDWQRKMEVEDPENSGLLPSEMATAISGARKAGAAGICLFTPGRMSPEHWAELEKAIR